MIQVVGAYITLDCVVCMQVAGLRSHAPGLPAMCDLRLCTVAFPKRYYYQDTNTQRQAGRRISTPVCPHFRFVEPSIGYLQAACSWSSCSLTNISIWPAIYALNAS